MEKTKDVRNYDSETVRFAVNAVFKHILAAICVFFCSSASFDGLAPFGVAAVAAVFPEYIPAAVLGSVAGYFRIYSVTLLTLRYIASAAIAGILSYLCKHGFKRKYHKYFSAVSGFFPLFVSGLIISLSVTLSADEIILYAAEGTVAALCAWFGDAFINITPMKRYASRLTGVETTAVLVVLGVFLLSLQSFQFLIFSPGVIVGAYIVLVLASYGGDKYGALSGICAGVVIGLSESGIGFVTGGFALGGLFVGIFGKRRRFISAIILIITMSVTAFATDDWITASHILYDVGLSSLLFILTPGKIIRQYKKTFALADDGAFLDGQMSVLASRLHAYSDGMNDVASTVKAVGGIYRRRSMPDEKQIHANVENKICKNCDMASVCLEQKGEETRRWFSDIVTALKRNDQPDEREMPRKFFNRCNHSGEVIKALGFELECYRGAMRECASVGETVNIVADQFSSVAAMLGKFSETMQNEEEFDAVKTDLARSVLKKDAGLNVLSCGVFKNIDGYIYCEMSFPKGVKYNFSQIKDTLNDIMGVRFDAPVIRKLTDGIINFSVCEKTKYSAVSGAFQINSGGGKWCGDTYDTFFDGKGKFIIVLSDGMGTGKKAAADSVVCSSLAAKLLRAGYPVESIIKMINAAMIVRSGEESLATLDIAIVDLYTGDVAFYKAGAGFSVAMKHMKMLKINKSSLPIGILRDISFEKIELNIRDGDTIVLMSDGVTDDAVNAWRNMLHGAEDYEGNELAEKLAKAAVLNAEEGSADDITVITTTLKLNNDE